MINFSVVIPTYKREKDLESLFLSIEKQIIFPTEIIVLDDDALPGEYISKWKEKFASIGIDLVYYKKDHLKKEEEQGCTSSRNLGIEKGREDIIFILDDDLILDEDYFEKTMKVWEEISDENLIGVAGVIKNNRKKICLEKIYNKIFGLKNKLAWDVNDVGFQSWDDYIEKRTKGYYMHGGVCAYKKSLTQKLGFTVFASGRTGLIDPEFSIRAKKKGYYFIIEPEAKVIHNHSQSGRESAYLSGVKESRNRKFMFRNYCKHSVLNKLLFFWAWFGWTLRQLLTFKFKKVAGMVKGFIFN